MIFVAWCKSIATVTANFCRAECFIRVPLQITTDLLGVVVKFNGVVTISDITDMNEALYSDARFETCRYQMFDFISADLSGIRIDALNETARNDAEMSQEFPAPAVAIISQQPIGGALAYHYKMLAEAHRIA